MQHNTCDAACSPGSKEYFAGAKPVLPQEVAIKTNGQWYRPLVVLAALGLGWSCYVIDPALLSRFALPLEDTKFSVRAALGQAPLAADDIVIVAVDETSINQLGRYPWRRQVMAKLIHNLAEARLVGLDMVFADVTDPQQDRQLAAAMAEAGNVVAGFFLRSQATSWTSQADLDQLAEWAFGDVEARDAVVGVKDYPFVETNLPQIGAAALAGGFFNGEPDRDGLYRRYPLAYIHQGYVLPSLAVQLARYQLDREAKLVLDRTGIAEFSLGDLHLTEGTLRLNFGEPSQAPLVSAVDVITGALPPEFFRDKLVLVGVTEVGIFDLRPTPVAPVIPGVWIHYTALANLLQGRVLRTVPAVDLGMLAVVLALAWWICRLRRLSLRLVLYLLVPLALVGMANALLLAADLWTREFYILFPYLLLTMALEANGFFRSELQAGELKRAFTSYVSPEVVREILEHPEKLDLGGVERDISILFSDIRGFTSLAEKISASQLVQMLNHIHDPFTQVVLQQRGMLDKYIGDAMMALFNTPVPVENHPDRAVRAALDIVAQLEGINRDFARDGLPLVDVGVGVNSGRCVVGNMGSKVRFEYTAIGDAVNLASRLEGLCKIYRTRVVISEFTRARLREPFLLRLLDRVRVKGKEQPVGVFEVMVDNEGNRQVQQRFSVALESYWQRAFAQAGAQFSAVATDWGDPTAAVFVERCRLLQASPPPGDWDGVFELMSK